MVKYKFREAKHAIRNFLRYHYSDEKLAALLAHAQSGRLNYLSCCCMVGVSTADHPLRENMGWSLGHLGEAYKIDGGRRADTAYRFLGRAKSFGGHSDDAKRRRILIPMIRAELKRRESRIWATPIGHEQPSCVGQGPIPPGQSSETKG